LLPFKLLFKLLMLEVISLLTALALIYPEVELGIYSLLNQINIFNQ